MCFDVFRQEVQYACRFESNMKEKNNETTERNWRIFSVIITVVYLLFHLWLCQFHEAWRDEGQAWMIAKFATLPEMFDLLSTEGHPCAWFLALFPLAKLGYHFSWLGYFTTALMALSVWLWLQYAPFPKLVRLLCITSSVFLYYNAVIARVYSLTVLLSVAVAHLFEKRFEKPILYSFLAALLTQTHILMSGIGIGLFLEYVFSFFAFCCDRNECASWQRSKKNILYAGIAMQACSIGLLFIELRQNSSSLTFIHVSSTSLVAGLNPVSLCAHLKGLFSALWGSELCSAVSVFLFCILCLAVVILFVSCKSERKIISFLLIAFPSLSIFFAIMLLVRGADHPQLSICLNVILFFLLWIVYEAFDSEDKRNLFRITVVCVLILCSSLTWKNSVDAICADVKGRFSNSLPAAEKMIAMMPEDSVVIAGMPQYVLTSAAYVADKRSDIEFVDYYSDGALKYNIWGYNYSAWSVEQIIQFAEAHGLSGENVFFISENNLHSEQLKLFFEETEENLWNENIYVYSLNR